MTDLYINNQQVILPNGFSLKLVKENPFFTKSSSYTYDIVLSLQQSTNAKVFKHINRFNAPKDRKSMPALLRVDGRTILNGTAVICNITDTEIKLQLLSGNSELNFVAGGDKYINELDLGSGTFRYDGTYRKFKGDYIFGAYPTYKYVYFPVYNENTGQILNNIIARTFNDNDIKEELYGLDTPIPHNMCCQPYLAYIVEKVIECIGYQLKVYEIDNTLYNQVYIVNGQVTNIFKEMLPHWTVNEFFTEIEKLFDLKIIVEENAKEIIIYQASNYYKNAPVVHLTQTIDSYSSKIEKDVTISHRIANIGYKLPDNSAHEYNKLDEKIYKLGVKKEMNSVIDIQADINAGVINSQQYIYLDKSSQTEYISYTENDAIYSPRKVNIFADIINNEEKADLDIELSIVPTSISLQDIRVLDTYMQYWNNEQLWIGTAQMPTVNVPAMETDQSGNLSIMNLIADGAVAEKYIPDVIEIAIKPSRLGNLSNGRNRRQYPMGMTDFLSDTGGVYITESLRLNHPTKGLNALYQQADLINTTEERTIKFLSTEIYNAQSIFMINGGKFVCKQIDYEINKDGIVALKQGVFYPME